MTTITIQYPTMDGGFIPTPYTEAEEWNTTNLHCPSCGVTAVYVQPGDGDYYVGPTHVCAACGGTFTLQDGAVDERRATLIREVAGVRYPTTITPFTVPADGVLVFTLPPGIVEGDFQRIAAEIQAFFRDRQVLVIRSGDMEIGCLSWEKTQPQMQCSCIGQGPASPEYGRPTP